MLFAFALSAALASPSLTLEVGLDDGTVLTTTIQDPQPGTALLATTLVDANGHRVTVTANLLGSVGGKGVMQVDLRREQADGQSLRSRMHVVGSTSPDRRPPTWPPDSPYSAGWYALSITQEGELQGVQGRHLAWELVLPEGNDRIIFGNLLEALGLMDAQVAINMKGSMVPRGTTCEPQAGPKPTVFANTMRWTPDPAIDSGFQAAMGQLQFHPPRRRRPGQVEVQGRCHFPHDDAIATIDYSVRWL